MIVKIKTGYEPRTHQKQIHKQLKRFNVLLCHRRFGKTHFAINEMLDKGLSCELKDPRYFYIAPDFKQAKRVAWDILKEYTKNIPNVYYNETELRVDIPRPDRGDVIRFTLLGAENPESLRGIYIDGVIFDEFASMNPEVWTSIVRPALSDRIGWAIFIGTPKGQNHFYDLYRLAVNRDSWFRIRFRASETKIIPAEELKEARETMDEHEYLQEYECDFAAALLGSYFGKELSRIEEEKKISKVPYDSSVPVFTGWDLGISDTTTIWFAQVIGREIHIIDYYEDSGVSLDEYVKLLKSKPYLYEEHYLPHDAAARELGTGKTREETLKSLGLRGVKIVPRTKNKADDIHAARMLIKKCWFDEKACEAGLAALRNYQRKWDAKRGVFLNTPLHDWSSHAADGFMTLSLGLDENRPSQQERTRLPRKTVSDYNILD